MSDPARPVRPATLARPLPFLRALQDNFIGVWPDDAYARDATRVRVGRRVMVTANAPALVKHVLLDNAANYHKSPIARRLFEPALGQGLLTSEGATWKRHRQMVAPVFVQRRMAALVPAMVAATQAHTAAWGRETDSSFDLTEALSVITLDIITRTMFGAESFADITTLAADTVAYQKILRPSLLDFLGAPSWVPRPGDAKARRFGDRLTERIDHIIARRRAQPDDRDDLLAHLLRAVDQDGVSPREIRDEIATTLTAGHETTAATVAWSLYLLDLYPETEGRLVDELRRVLDGRPPVAGDIEALRFTRMVIEEALRLYPPAHSMTRQALGPDRLGDVAVPKGAVVVISPWLLHRNPTLWPDPDRFDPDRFDPSRSRNRYSYIPFGTGSRVCVGASFAMTEAILVLATMLQNFRIRLVADQPIEPVALITLRPRHGLRATAERR